MIMSGGDQYCTQLLMGSNEQTRNNCYLCHFMFPQVEHCVMDVTACMVAIGQRYYVSIQLICHSNILN